MTIEQMNAFMRLVENDAEVARKVEDIGYDNIDGLLTYARELRLDIDQKDFEAAKKEALKATRKLSGDKLDSVSGGWFFPRPSDDRWRPR